MIPRARLQLRMLRVPSPPFMTLKVLHRKQLQHVPDRPVLTFGRSFGPEVSASELGPLQCK